MVESGVFVVKTYHVSSSFNEFDALLQYSTFRSYTDRHLDCYTVPDDAFDHVLIMSSSAR